jgi:2-dehydropantoate 2-reductase
MNTYTVIGPGALGCCCSHILSEAGHDIVLIDHRPDRARVLAREGITFEREGRETCRQIPVDCEIPDRGGMALICVKAGALGELIQEWGARLDPFDGIALLQNGGQWIEQSGDIGNPHVGGGVVYFGVTLLSPGCIRWAGDGPMLIGALGPTGKAPLQEIGDDLKAAGLKAEYTGSIHREVWKKLLVNLAINPLTVKFDCANGELLDGGPREELLMQIAGEGLAAAAAAGHAFEREAILATVRGTCRKTMANISSMLADVRKGLTTELEAITGFVLHIADQAGLDLPLNRKLYQELRGGKP